MVKDRFDNLNSEHGLLVLFVVISAYMVTKATSFGRSSAVFPLFAGSITLIGALLLLFRGYLPEPLYTVVTGSTNLSGTRDDDDDDVEEVQEQVAAETEADAEQVGHPDEAVLGFDRPLHPSLFTGILVALYIGTSYLFSMLLMTPLFIIAYLVWFSRPWYTIVAVVLIGLALAYAFATILIVPVDRGIFVSDLLFLTPHGVI